MKQLDFNGCPVGAPDTCYIIGDIGINHNGDLALAKKLITYAKTFDFDCVKFQKRNPHACVPAAQRDRRLATPWGEMTYFEYKLRIEFGEAEYRELDEYCRQLGIAWTASVWDLDSLEFIRRFPVPFIKLPSAMLTNEPLLIAAARTGRPVVLSTGMSTLAELDRAVAVLREQTKQIALLHCTSTYPAKLEELNLRCIPALQQRYPDCVIGYSGHEFGLDTTMVSAVLGAKIVERHITIDRTLWGSDQMCSVEPHGMYRLVRDIRWIVKALGDGEKRLYDSELPGRKKLRGC